MRIRNSSSSTRVAEAWWTIVGDANICGRHRFSLVGDLSVKRSGRWCLGVLSTQSHRGGRRRLPFSFVRPYPLGGIGDRWFLWGKRNALRPSEVAHRFALFLCYLACFLFRRFFGWDHRGRVRHIVGKRAASARQPSDSTHRKMVSLSSSMAAHPARPKLATDTEMSAPKRRRAWITWRSVSLRRAPLFVCPSRAKRGWHRMVAVRLIGRR